MINKKRIAADILKSGASRIRVLDAKQLEDALTRQDIRNLIRKGVVIKVQKKGTSKAFSKILLKQKKKGRRSGAGKRKGTYKTRNPKKRIWIKTVRPLRKMLKEMLDNGQLDRSNKKTIYNMIKGRAFRNKSHLLYYLKDHDLLKKREVKKTDTIHSLKTK